MQVTTITPELKKGKLDTQQLDAQVSYVGNMIFVIIDKPKHELDKSPRTHLGVGTVVVLDGKHYLCAKYDLVGCPVQYRLECYPF